MLNFIDIFVIFILLYAAGLGWQKGIIRLGLSFFSFLLSSLIAHLYFINTNNIIYALALFLVSVLFLSVFLSHGLKIWNKKICKGKPPFILSRILACCLTLCWAILFLGIILFSLSIIPAKGSAMEKTRDATLNSYSYNLIKINLKNILPSNVSSFIESLQKDDVPALQLDVEQAQTLQSTEEFKYIYENEKIQEILKDEELMESLQSQDIASIIKNPKIYKLLQDPKLIEKIKQLYQHIQGMQSHD